MLAVADDGGVRRGDTRLQLEVELEVGDDLLRHEADQVGVPREAGLEPRERPCADRSAAGVVETLEHEDGEPRPGEVGRRHQAVVAASDDDDVVLALLTPCGHGWHATCRAPGGSTLVKG